ncbi:unnamed protein product [Spirodela intermedia]|uniref:Uncharacterized protein n=1 Tax=Spirodela intermedia TaxID=51605 RepID=A0A7I8JAS5_SPIIN|nr:unnamed protein product [Spirodela intermedia]CAA6666542.1 unnamed protein product [Spirodela intermedia]
MAPPSEYQSDIMLAELKAFDEMKAGVKGVVESGIKAIPRIFLLPAAERDANEGAPDPPAPPLLELPVVDISAVLGHGVPTEVLEEMLAGIRRFNELHAAEKAAFYSEIQPRG